MKILINHMGYEQDDYKKAVCQGISGETSGRFTIRSLGGNAVLNGTAKEEGEVPHWNTGFYWTIDFTELCTPGVYQIELETLKGVIHSSSFVICKRLNTMKLLNAVSYYFKAQRSTGEWLHADRSLSFQGDKEGIVDLHGGWYDATGDYGIHLTQLSYTSIHNPQQAAFSSYVFYQAVSLLEQSGNEEYSMLKRRMMDEAAFGADFVMRLKAPSGSFYRSIDRGEAFSCVSGGRKVDYEYHKFSRHFAESQKQVLEDITDRNYEVGFRSGGGSCIAVLAAAARRWYPGTDFTCEQYITTAKESWNYLYHNNEKHVNDGRWNLLDYYCALIAAVELYRTTGEYEYLLRCREMADNMIKCMKATGENMAWFESRTGELFFNAADEGLPVMALLQYFYIEQDKERRKVICRVVEQAMRHVLKVTNEVCNPFGYARFMDCRPDKDETTRFFFPHDTTTAPWWQGDNARIASLAAAARALSNITGDDILLEKLRCFADNQINWILGLNPFDSCMVEGYGRNNISYFFHNRYDFMNCPGGVCNGITGGLHDDKGIEFVMESTEEVDDNWRWAEQWLPHGSWVIWALAEKRR